MQRIGRIVVGITFFIAIQGELAAQEAVAPTPGTVVTPRFELPAQQTPPDFFGGEGPKTGALTPNTPYIVLQQKSYPSLTGHPQQWIKVAPAYNTPHAKESGEPSWVYYGRKGTIGNLKAY